MDLKSAVLEKAVKEKDFVIEVRRKIHQYPELSGREFKTSEFIAETLKKLGVDEVYEGFGKTTGVVALIKGNGSSTVALRADMDALPVKEETGKDYASKNEGVMHACGHDAHVAMLIGVAKILISLKDFLKGNVKLIFQPCEESQECRGARKLIEAGVLKNPDVDVIFGIHVYPELESGKIGTMPGAIMASADVFEVTLKGKGTHASKPHLGVDTVLMAAQTINALHHIVSRKVDPLDPVVLTVGTVRGGIAENVIPEEVKIKGTVRTLNFNVREKIPEFMETAIKGITSAYGGDYLFKYEEGTPPLINDEKVTTFAVEKTKELLGDKKVIILKKPSMGSEDFSEYLKYVPGCYLRLGTGNREKGTDYPLHSPFFDIDEDALPIGVSVLSYLSLKWLEDKEWKEKRA